jgi:hypothetical protein
VRATCVVAMAVGAVLASAGCAAEQPAASPGTPSGTTAGPTPAHTAVPPGYRQVTFHGLAIGVPTSWPVNATHCGQPVRDTVILPGAVPACGVARVPSATSVEFVDDQQVNLASTLTQASSSGFALAGERATRLTGRLGRLFVIAVAVRVLSAQVIVTSPRLDLARSLAATLTITDSDSNGCPSRATNTSVLPKGSKPSRSGAADALIPPTPNRLTVCRYVAALLEQSGSLDARHRVAFIAALNGLPRGLSRANTDTYLPELCRRPSTDPGTLTGPSATDGEAYVVTATYDTGPNVTVIARLNLCGDLGASNGTRTGQRTDALVNQLVGAAGNSEGWSGAIHPAP